MTIQQLFAHLDSFRIEIAVEDGELRCRGKGEPMPAALMEELKERKEAVIRYLEESHTEPDSKLPYLNKSGDLVIPFNSATKYHWWRPGGMSVGEMENQLKSNLIH